MRRGREHQIKMSKMENLISYIEIEMNQFGGEGGWKLPKNKIKIK